METFVIGIIDDDSSKVTQIITHLCEGWSGISPEKSAKYSEYSLSPEEIPVSQNMNDVIEAIIEKEVDCVIIDYRLSSYAAVSYTGVALAKKLESIKHGFPIFLLTSYEDDIYTKEIFDVYQIFNFDRYQNDAQERNELNTKIVEQILKHRKQKSAWIEELQQLLPQQGTSAKIDSRIVQLDGYIESSIDNRSALSADLKRGLLEGKIDQLLTKLDDIISRG